MSGLGSADSEPTGFGSEVACIYSGRVRHRRFSPKPHSFSYRLYMSYFELGRVEDILASVACASATSPALVRYRRQDYFGNTEVSLDQAVRDLVSARTGRPPEGPIRLLTHLRTWGVSFNPVSFYYCFDATGSEVEHVVAEINNTPWDERYTYVLSDPVDRKELASDGPNGSKRPRMIETFKTPKEFHVSPFIDMDVQYLWKLSPPGESLLVHMEDHPLSGSDKIFDATLSMDRRLPLTSRELLSSQLKYPAMPVMVLFGIYRQALSLWMKKVPFYSHPRKRIPHEADS